MFKFKSNLALYTLLFVWTVGNSAAAQSVQRIDEGYLEGLKIAMAVLSDYNGSYGDLTFNRGTFLNRRNMARIISQSIASDLPAISNPFLKVQLSEVAGDLISLHQDYVSGEGQDHMRQLLGMQHSTFLRAAERIASLADLVATSEGISASYELGFLKGVAVALKAVAGAGVRFSILDSPLERTFTLRKNGANMLADQLRAELQNVSNPHLKFSLRELSLDILSAPQTGRLRRETLGSFLRFENLLVENDNVWSQLIEAQSDALARALSKLEAVISTAAREPVVNAQGIANGCRSVVGGI